MQFLYTLYPEMYEVFALTRLNIISGSFENNHKVLFNDVHLIKLLRSDASCKSFFFSPYSTLLCDSDRLQ